MDQRQMLQAGALLQLQHILGILGKGLPPVRKIPLPALALKHRRLLFRFLSGALFAPALGDVPRHGVGGQLLSRAWVPPLIHPDTVRHHLSLLVFSRLQIGHQILLPAAIFHRHFHYVTKDRWKAHFLSNLDCFRPFSRSTFFQPFQTGPSPVFFQPFPLGEGPDSKAPLFSKSPPLPLEKGQKKSRRFLHGSSRVLDFYWQTKAVCRTSAGKEREVSASRVVWFT